MQEKSKLKQYFQLMASIILIQNVVSADVTSPKYRIGTSRLAVSDSDFQDIPDDDIHYDWELGDFFISGYSNVTKDRDKQIFLKNIGDEVTLWFNLKQDINCLNKNNALKITNGGINKKDKGQGTLIIKYIDSQGSSKVTLYQDYLKSLMIGADTNIRLLEEGDYELILDYKIRNTYLNMSSFLFWDVDIHTLPSYTDYRINFQFSVRNGNCMVFFRDLKNNKELTTLAPNGFYIDLTKSRYLDVNVEYRILENNTDKLDIRFNRPAKDGEQFKDEGVYKITARNRYTQQVTKKIIAVGNNPILNAYATTPKQSISEIKKRLGYASLLYSSNSIENTSDSSEQLSKIQNELYEGLEKGLEGTDYKIEKVDIAYVSKEYIEESQYNSLSNVYFGKSLRELEEQFKEEKFVFTLGEDNKTVVQAFKTQDNICKKVIKDVAIGSGVILVMATVSVATGGTTSVIFAVAAKTGLYSAFSTALCNSIIIGAIKGIKTKNFDETIKSIVVAGSEGFKWGAIAGVVVGGASKTWEIKQTADLAKATINSETKATATNIVKTSNVSKATTTNLAKKIYEIGREFEQKVFRKLKIKKSDQQVTFKNGVRSQYGEKGYPRVDGVLYENGRIIAIETKSRDLEKGLSVLVSELRKQVLMRAQHLPKGSLQRIIIDKKNYSKEFLDKTREVIQKDLQENLQKLKDAYKDIPTDVIVEYM